MKISLLGYPGSGKTRFIEVAVGKKIENFDPFKPSIVRVKTSDPCLEKLSHLVKAAKTTFPEVEIYDIKGISRQTNLNDEIIPFLLQTDIIVFIIDNFSGNRSPEKDIQSLILEIIFKDTERLSELINKRHQEQTQGKKQLNNVEENIIKKAISHLEKEKPLVSLVTNEEEKSFISSLGFLSIKPILLFINGEKPENSLEKLMLELQIPYTHIDLSPNNSVIDLSIFWKTLLQSVNLITFYTVGEKDTRAWILKKGASALDAAGTIHTDIAKGFIRAEVITYQDFIKYGSHSACRNANVMRLESKDYIISDEDILNIRFSRP
jgi:ribosome-binding ATPase YchF (GTP1/OBG family)